MKTINAQGLSCPQPVILTRKAIEAGEFPFIVLVETVTSRENVRRIASKFGCAVTSVEKTDGFAITINRP